MECSWLLQPGGLNHVGPWCCPAFFLGSLPLWWLLGVLLVDPPANKHCCYVTQTQHLHAVSLNTAVSTSLHLHFDAAGIVKLNMQEACCASNCDCQRTLYLHLRALYIYASDLSRAEKWLINFYLRSSLNLLASLKKQLPTELREEHYTQYGSSNLFKFH